MKIFTRIALIVMLCTGVGLTFASTADAGRCCNDANCCVGACCYADSTGCWSWPCSA
jgi:hypothetical protein